GGAEQNLAGAGVAFLGQGDMAYALVLVGADVVIVRKLLLGHELPQRIDVAVGHLVFGVDVVIGNDDDFLAVPDLGVLAEVMLEDADGAWAAHVVGHEDVRIDPDVVAGNDA